MATINKAGIDLLKEFEGFRDTAYQDGVGVWTIGYGFTKDVKPGDKITRKAADKRLIEELSSEYINPIIAACTKLPNENQLAAMGVLAWNIGIAGFLKSTVLKAHNRGDEQAAARAFGLWNKAGGKVVAGLTRRRAAESALYLKPIVDVPEDKVEMPQKVDPEMPMSKSGIVSASTLTAGTSTLALVSEGSKLMKDTSDNVHGMLGEYFPLAALVVIIVSCGYIVYKRFGQRADGWV